MKTRSSTTNNSTSRRLLAVMVTLSAAGSLLAVDQDQSPGITSLTNEAVTFTVPERHYHRMERNGIEAIVVDNHAGDISKLSQHRAGYNGLAYLGHIDQQQNVFVPFYAGLNFEHIHDGDSRRLVEKFEPRKSPMELRVVDEYTVELYQPPTANFQLESCGRYQLLPDGTVEYTFECIPRGDTFTRGFIGLFWASYINQPADKAIYIRGRLAANRDDKTRWIRAVTPRHGVLAGHAPVGKPALPDVDGDFPLTLVNHPSKYVATESWCYGVRGDYAFVQIFRREDNIWMVQSPSGGGGGNPAWDFQWFSPDFQVGKRYGFTMRAALVPFKNTKEIEQFARPHREALDR
jgi:hypothetical protein